MVHCSICGYPIMPEGCPHTILNLTPAQWLEYVREKGQQGARALRIDRRSATARPTSDTTSKEIGINE